MGFSINKSDVKRRITLGCLVDHVKESILWSSLGVAPPPPPQKKKKKDRKK